MVVKRYLKCLKFCFPLPTFGDDKSSARPCEFLFVGGDMLPDMDDGPGQEGEALWY